MSRVSIIILSWNGKDLLHDCLLSVLSQSYQDLEVLVVDNGSSDGTAEMLEADFPRVRLLRQQSNRGFCAGNNIAIEECSGELLLLLNNDAELDRCFVETMVAAADEYPETGMFAARVMMFDRREVFDSTGLLVYPDGICRSRGWLEKDLGQYDRDEEVLGPNGCAAVYRREMLDDVGLFDEAYFAYLEDLDLVLRGQLRGWSCRYVAAATVYHKKSMTSGYHSAFKAFLVERNRIWNALKLFPRRILFLSAFYTLARYLGQAFAAFSGRGISSNFARDYSHLELVGILIRAYASAFARLPEIIRARRDIQLRRKLSTAEVYRLMQRYRLPVAELAFKD